jgi:hypothetical protein
LISRTFHDKITLITISIIVDAQNKSVLPAGSTDLSKLLFISPQNHITEVSRDENGHIDNDFPRSNRSRDTVPVVLIR